MTLQSCNLKVIFSQYLEHYEVVIFTHRLPKLRVDSCVVSGFHHGVNGLFANLGCYEELIGNYLSVSSVEVMQSEKKNTCKTHFHLTAHLLEYYYFFDLI